MFKNQSGKVEIGPGLWVLMVIGLLVGIYFGVNYAKKNGLLDKATKAVAPSNTKADNGPKLSKEDKKDVIKVGVVTWGGYAGGQYFNEGFKASKNSRFYTEYGILVEFIVMDDFDASRAAWKADEVNVMWFTADAFPIEASSFTDYQPEVFFQSDWSRGGDAIVVRKGLNTVSDLRGKKVSVAYGTPSNTFLLWMLEANNMTKKDVEMVPVNSAVDAAVMFKSGQVDAAVVWSPDDEDCVKNIAGSKILISTKKATYIIADVFYAKKSYIDENEDKLVKLTEGWMRGAAEINSSEENLNKAAQILSDGLGQDYAYCLKAIKNTRLCTFGDNKGFFQINGCNSCVTVEQLYTKMSKIYTDFDLIKGTVPPWRTVSNTKILRKINLAGAEHESEGMQTFTKASKIQEEAPAIASKSVSIVFRSGSFSLTDDNKNIIDRDVVPGLKAFGAVRIRVEGNTDDVGDRLMNVQLSRKRAASAIDYLVEIHNFDRNRFIAIGNGPDKPVASNDTPDGKSMNRRTEFQFLD
jgi:NitT/TauT family transport system substrate-binding protein